MVSGFFTGVRLNISYFFPSTMSPVLYVEYSRSTVGVEGVLEPDCPSDQILWLLKAKAKRLSSSGIQQQLTSPERRVIYDLGFREELVG